MFSYLPRTPTTKAAETAIMSMFCDQLAESTKVPWRHLCNPSFMEALRQPEAYLLS